MFSLQRTLSVGYLMQHRLRALLVVASIALGVAVFVATETLSQALTKGAKGASTPLAEFADLLIVNGQTGVPRKLVEQLREAGIPGLRDVQPLVLGRILLPDLHNRSVLLLGVDWQGAAAGASSAQGMLGRDNSWGVRVEETASPRAVLNLLLEGRKPVMVGKGLAATLEKTLPADRKANGSLALTLKGPKDTVLAATLGTVELQGSTAILGSDVVFMDIDAAAALVRPDRPDTVGRINLRLDPGVDREDMRERLQELVHSLGSRGSVRTVEANDESVQDVLAALQLGFSLGGIGALLVGVFLVYNTLSVNVAERRHDIGVMRAVGATRSQVARLFLGEAILLGLLGSLLGLPLGQGLMHLAMIFVRQILNDLMGSTEGLHFQLQRGTLLLALGAGTLSALLAALIPALQASREEPASAVRRVPVRIRISLRFLHLAVCVLLLVAGVVLAASREHLPGRVGVFAGVCCLFLSFLVSVPLLISGVGLFPLPLLRPLLGLPGRLAADNLVRRPGRTGLVVAALAATGGLMVQTAGFIRSSEDAVHDWVENNIAADLYLTAGSSMSNAGLSLPMPQKIGLQVAELPEVEAVVGIRYHHFDYKGHIVFVLAVDSDAFDKVEESASQANASRNLKRFPRLKDRGTALVSENFALLNGIKVGDHITLPTLKGDVDLEVIGTAVDYSWQRGTVIVDRGWFSKDFGDSTVDLYDIYLKPGQDPEAVRRQIVDRWGKEEALFVATRAELHELVSDQLQRVYSLAYAQQTVIGLVAMLGVISALLISVLQRRRELGLLRAVGASRPQVLRSVVAEATLMGTLGALFAFVFGLGLEWYVLRIILLDEAGFVFPLKVPWLAAAFVLGSSVVFATLVGLGPASVATRLRIAEAIAYE